MNTNKQILYITYDGMTDPLGQSQVLPYLVGLAKVGYKFTILSFEKADRFEKFRNTIEGITKASGIKWIPLSFTTKPPVVSKFYDAMRMRLTAFRLHKQHKFDLIHCRSYIAAGLGLSLKRKTGVKFLFDMRGFWADEKKDAGTWDQRKFIFRKIYKYYKKKEKEFIMEADYVISLTHAGHKVIKDWSEYNGAVPVSVIPCCADMDHFSLTSPEDKIKGREILGLPANALIVSYLGSVGAWYMLDEMLELFVYIKQKYANAKFLFITHSSPLLILEKLSMYGINPDDVVIREANRQEVPVFTKTSDINISFIKPVFSKLASSPTKLGEVLAMGIPVIVNSGVGDVEEIIKETGGGIVIHSFDKNELETAAEQIQKLQFLSPVIIRERAEQIYSLKKGTEKYIKCYSEIFNNKECL